MIDLADKFTRTGLVEGDIYYATTASSSKSRESLEDNIDAGLFGWVGSDTTGGSVGNSSTETGIGQVIVPANTVNNRLLIFATVRLENTTTTSSTLGSTFRIRTGTSATPSSNTERESLVINFRCTSGGTPVSTGIFGGFIMTTVTSAQETFTGQVYVDVTASNDDANANLVAYCDNVYVIGI